MPPLLSEDAATHFYRCRRVPPLMPPPVFIGATMCHHCCRHPFLSGPPRAATDAATHVYRCRRVLLPMPPPMRIGAAGSFPFPGEKGSEKGTQKVWEGVRKNQTSSGSLVRSLVVGTAVGSEWICIAPDRILHQGAGSFHSGLDLRAPTCSDACHTMLNVRLSRPTQPLPHISSYLIL